MERIASPSQIDCNSNASGERGCATASGVDSPRVAFVMCFGSHGGDFFSDTLLALLCADTRQRGAVAELIHVHFDGRDQGADAVVDDELFARLAVGRFDVVVTDRIIRPNAFLRWKELGAGPLVLVPTDDGISNDELADVALFASPYSARRAPRAEQHTDKRNAFSEWLDVRADPMRWADVPGAWVVVNGVVVEPRTPLAEARARGERHLLPIVSHHTIAPHGPQPKARYTVYGNAGCPYSKDVSEAPPYQSLQLRGEGLLHLGCSMCHMGGDYERRSDASVIESLVAQVRRIVVHDPSVSEVLLSDQYPIRYLAALLKRAHELGLPRISWLIQTRADWLLQEADRLRAAIDTARNTEQRIELYLVGFESFSDEELVRYNKGTTVDEQVRAVDLMRALSLESAGTFAYGDARGHSVILFNPWTTPRHLAESASVMREHGLGDLFHDISRNRLRLYPALPIHALAQRDALVSDSWPTGALASSSTLKGYHGDIPWRFADARTHLAYELCGLLRDELGPHDQIAHLRAVAAHVATLSSTVDVGTEVGRVRAGVKALVATFGALLARPGTRAVAANVVKLSGPCNNGCESCANRDAYAPDDVASLSKRIDMARQNGRPIVIAGREPTLHPAFLSLVARARGDDDRNVGLVTNGRRFATAPFVRAARAAGLTSAGIKLFGPTAGVADLVTRAPGAHEQSVLGATNLVASGASLEARIMLSASSMEVVAATATLAVAVGASAVRLDAPLDAVTLAALDRLPAVVAAIDRACAEAGVPLLGTTPKRAMQDWEALPGGNIAARFDEPALPRDHRRT